jgi:hypothetical protein
MKYLFVILFAVSVLTTTAIAQEVYTTTVAPPVIASKVTTEIIAASSTKVVKGAPFSAEGISESLQILADGNKITRSTTTKMFRDGEGRFRREAAVSSSGGVVVNAGIAATAPTYSSIATVYGFQDTISIFDPVENVRYVLTPSSKTARRYSNKSPLAEGAVIVNGQPVSEAYKAQIETKAIAAQKVISHPGEKAQVVVMGNVASTYNAGKTESLGTKSFEGIEAEGTRTVKTIAAGTIGNEKPIEIVYERWHSKELDLTVYSRHYDPRFGDQTYRLRNINRSEPDRSLFAVPSDYKLLTETPLKFYTTKPE